MFCNSLILSINHFSDFCYCRRNIELDILRAGHCYGSHSLQLRHSLSNSLRLQSVIAPAIELSAPLSWTDGADNQMTFIVKFFCQTKVIKFEFVDFRNHFRIISYALTMLHQNISLISADGRRDILKQGITTAVS